MEEVSVDTNIWISLARLGVVQEAFRLPYRYLMEETAAKDELLSPRDLLLRVCALGLVTTTLSEEELFYVLSLQGKHGYARSRHMTFMRSPSPSAVV